MIINWIRNKMRKMMTDLLDERHYQLVEEVSEVIEIPDAGDIAGEINMYKLVQEISYGDLCYEIDMSELAGELDVSDVAKNIDVDISQVEIDYTELAADVSDNLDLEEIARHADIDKVIHTELHVLQRKLDAIIAVVNGSAMHTIDLMTFNEALEGVE